MDDNQLDSKLKELQEQLCCMMESQEIEAQTPPEELQTPPEEPPGNTSQNVLAELQRTFGVLQLDNNAPSLEFHGLGCQQQQQLPKRSRRSRGGQRSAGDAPQKKQRIGNGNGQNSLVSGQKQAQLQKENIWNQCMNDPVQLGMTPIITVERLRSIGVHGSW